MKKILIITTLCIFFAACADIKVLFGPRYNKSTQVNTELVPLAIQKNFKQKFPNKSVDKWFKIKSYMYVAQIKCTIGNKFEYFFNDGIYISKADLQLYDENFNYDADQDRFNDIMEDQDFKDNSRD